ncbi:MAG: hypothetical protein K5849_06215 [Bacteroidales bacterium]|nr:hypothetical protein [Bacteroidales bacterium]
MKKPFLFLLCLLVSSAALAQNQTSSRVDSTARKLADEGFANVRAIETEDYTVFTIENDRYKIPAEGFAYAAQIIESAGLDTSKPVKVIGTSYKVPEVTLTYNNGVWNTTKRLDSSWDAVRKQPKLNNSFAKADIMIYPQVSLQNLIINQVYQSVWTLNPTLHISLWPGMRFTYQLVIPVFTDMQLEKYYLIHPSFITLSQRFRDPWHLNIQGKLTIGNFSNDRGGIALEASYHFPNERFSVDAQLGLITYSSYLGFVWKYALEPVFRWNVGANYYNPFLKTQFSLRAINFIRGDYGIKFEMVRHFRHCSIGFYAEKGHHIPAGIPWTWDNMTKSTGFVTRTNGGFRFQIALPPYRMKRHGYIPRVTTSGQIGMAYNANNEERYYYEYRTEVDDNIMTKNYYNPYYINSMLQDIK